MTSQRRFWGPWTEHIPDKYSNRNINNNVIGLGLHRPKWTISSFTGQGFGNLSSDRSRDWGAKKSENGM